MSDAIELSRWEELQCRMAVETEGRGWLYPRVLPLVEIGLAGTILALTMRSVGWEESLGGPLTGAALAGILIGRALPELIGTRQRVIAKLYRAREEEAGAGQA